MSAKTILVLCASALFVNAVFSQCLGGRAGIGPGQGFGPGLAQGFGPGLAQGFGPALAPGIGLNPGLAGPYGCGGVSSSGGGFTTNSFSPLPPTGLSVISENSIEGKLTVGGNAPFLGTVALEGVLPTAGTGAISYGCGNGAVGINSEGGPISTGITSPGTYGPGVGPGLAGPLFGQGFAPGLGHNGLGYGCGGF